MTGLPITEIHHSRNTFGTSQIPIHTPLLPSETLMTAVNLSSKFPSDIIGKNISHVSASNQQSGMDSLPASGSSSLEVLPDFQQTSSVPQKVLGTTVNPLLMPMPTLEAKQLNVSFPPTQHLLHAARSIPTQSVETTGLIQAGSSIPGISSLNSDSLTIRITNVPTETTEQGILERMCLTLLHIKQNGYCFNY